MTRWWRRAGLSTSPSICPALRELPTHADPSAGSYGYRSSPRELGPEAGARINRVAEKLRGMPGLLVYGLEEPKPELVGWASADERRNPASRGPSREAVPCRNPSAYLIAYPCQGLLTTGSTSFRSRPMVRCRAAADSRRSGALAVESGPRVGVLGPAPFATCPDRMRTRPGRPCSMTGPQLCTLRTILSSSRVSIPGRAMAARRTSRKSSLCHSRCSLVWADLGRFGPVIRAPVFQLIRLVTMSSDEGPPKLIASFQEASRSNCDVGTRAVRSVRKIH